MAQETPHTCKMNLFCLVLLGCAGCNVPFSDSCHAVHHRDGGKGALPTSRSGLAVLHRSMWRSQRRPEVVGGASSKNSGSFVGTSTTTRRGISFGNPSIPCGPCIQPCTSYSAHPGRRRLGVVWSQQSLDCCANVPSGSIRIHQTPYCTIDFHTFPTPNDNMINNHTQTTIASHNHCQSLAVQT